MLALFFPFALADADSFFSWATPDSVFFVKVCPREVDALANNLRAVNALTDAIDPQGLSNLPLLHCPSFKRLAEVAKRLNAFLCKRLTRQNVYADEDKSNVHALSQSDALSLKHLSDAYTDALERTARDYKKLLPASKAKIKNALRGHELGTLLNDGYRDALALKRRLNELYSAKKAELDTKNPAIQYVLSKLKEPKKRLVKLKKTSIDATKNYVDTLKDTIKNTMFPSKKLKIKRDVIINKINEAEKAGTDFLKRLLSATKYDGREERKELDTDRLAELVPESEELMKRNREAVDFLSSVVDKERVRDVLNGLKAGLKSMAGLPKELLEDVTSSYENVKPSTETCLYGSRGCVPPQKQKQKAGCSKKRKTQFLETAPDLGKYVM